MSAPKVSAVSQPDTSSQDAAVAAALRQGTDASIDPRAVFEAIRDPDGTLVDLRILYGNAAYWGLTGFDPTLTTGRPFASLELGIDWSEGLAARLFGAMDGGGTFADSHVRFRTQSGPYLGQERVFEVEFVVVDDLMSARFRDVTDEAAHLERQAAEARRTSAIARFLGASVDPAIDRTALLGILAAELADTIGNLCVIVEQDVERVVVTAIAGGPGDVATRMSASRSGPVALPDPYRAAFLAGATVLQSPIPPDLRPQVAEAIRWLGLPDDLAQSVNSTISAAVMRGGQPVARIHLLRFGDDPPITGEDVATVEAISAAAALVLERRSVADHLASSRAQFEAVFELAPIAMVTVDSDRTVRFNQRATELYGRGREELTRMAFQADVPWIPADQADQWAEMRQRVAAGERVNGVRASIIRPSGERREIEGTSLPVVTTEGAHRGVVTVLADVTEHLSLESQLRHTQKMEALGRLAGGIAHDFNNVLMAIIGYAEFVARDARAGRPVKVEHADEIVASTRRAIAMTARLTTFARRDPARTEPVDVGEMVLALLPLMQGLTPESIEIVSHVEPVLAVTLDRSEFEQVLVNLTVNAIDAMPDGGRLTLEVEMIDLDAGHVAMHVDEMAGRHVLIVVSDTGIGMDEAVRSRIFEPFYTTKGVGEGTGLGLSMVFAAVERADGRIWVYSEPGHGTTFKIYLPPAAGAAATPIADTLDLAEAPGGSESILLLEDDPLVRGLLVTVLRRLGYVVTATGRPSEAFEVAVGRRFDLLISDVVMPEMMGDVVAAKLRLSQPDLRVVLMSGYTARAVDFQPGLRDSFVHKPLHPTDVARVVREALDREDPA